MQRLLLGGRTLTQTIEQLLPGPAETKPISAPAFAYCRASHKLPTLVAIQVFERIVDRFEPKYA